MSIRNYEIKDINEINKLGNLLHSNYKFKLDDFSNAFVIEDDNLIGFITYSIMYERAEIVDLVIKPNYRNKGYASKLISYVFGIIKRNSVKNITLEVNKNNICAIKVYEKLGFKICSLRKKYYNGQDGYLMIKDLR